MIFSAVFQRVVNYCLMKTEPFLCFRYNLLFEFIGGKMSDEIDGLVNKDNHLITRIPNGYMLRKTFNGDVYQQFFGFTKYGGEHAAFEAAKAEREFLLFKTSNFISFQKSNVNNKTGVVGTSLLIAKKNDSCVILNTRCQMPIGRGKTHHVSFSVKTYGLWRAFELAVEQRNKYVLRNKGEAVDPEDAFSVFIEYYVERMNLEDDFVIKGDMFTQVVSMIKSPATPDSIVTIARKCLVNVIN